MQAGLVGTETYTARDMELTRQLWAQRYSMMDWAVGLVLRSGVWRTQDGACQALLWSLPPISAHQTMPSLTMQGGGATLPSNILISLSLSSKELLSTKPGLCLWLTDGTQIGRLNFCCMVTQELLGNMISWPGKIIIFFFKELFCACMGCRHFLNFAGHASTSGHYWINNQYSHGHKPNKCMQNNL